MTAHQEFDPDRPQPDGQQTQQGVAPGAAFAGAGDDGAVPGLDAQAALQARLAELETQLTELQDQALRARAEADNARRRAQDDVTKARKFGIESFAEGLVPVKDSLEAALATPEQDVQAWRTGVEATLRQLVNAFDRNQLIEIAPAVGEKFDPHRHQAIASIPAEQASNTVVTVLQKGYLIADRVLRPALVTVAA